MQTSVFMVRERKKERDHECVGVYTVMGDRCFELMYVGISCVRVDLVECCSSLELS